MASKLKALGKPCPDCRQPVPDKAKICPNCKSYQDWRRYAGIGQTNLALIVAVFSIATTLFAIGWPLVTYKGAVMHLIIEAMDKDGGTFLLRNDGRSGGVVTIRNVLSTAPATPGGTNPPYYMLSFAHGGTYVEAGKEARVHVDYQEGLKSFKESCQWLQQQKTPSDVKCRFFSFAQDFYNNAAQVDLVFPSQEAMCSKVFADCD